MRDIFALVGAVLAGLAVFICTLTAVASIAIRVSERALDDGPGLTMAMMMFGVVPLLMSTASARVVSMMSRARPRLSGTLIGGALATAAFSSLALWTSYGSQLLLPAATAGLVGGAVAGWLSVVLAVGLRRTSCRHSNGLPSDR